ncbi:MAG TPA: flagellar hook-basal body protein [Syntrophales bacterium]|nr:flagellar hook-basal body protein [Syntrophales bacterium]
MIYSIGEMAHVYQQTFDQLDYVASNIVNSNTTGFKAVKLFYPAVDPTKEMSFTPEVVVDYAPGSIYKTDNVLDVAINGEGFFAVRSGDEITYTRQGNFTLDKDGNLVTLEGNYVLNKSGNKIKIPNGTVQISQKGDISVDGNQIDTLKITNFTNPQALVRIEGCLFADPGNAGVVDKENPVISQGHIELSNVQVVKEMTDMIDIHRSVEVYQKVIQTIADQDKLATSQIGRLA